MPSRRAAAKEPLLNRLDAEAEAFCRALEREYYLNSSGLKEELSLAPIFERHALLFSADTVAALAKGGRDDPRLIHDQGGKRLTELWSLGQRYPVEELARQIGYPSLDTTYVLSELTT